MTDRWQEVFAPSPVPGWLVAFDDDPDEAVDSLLWGRFYFGHLQAAEPADLLIDWGRLLGDEGDFLPRLDAALAAWVFRCWGTVPESRTAARVADAWSRLAEVVTCLDKLEATAAALRAGFEEAREYLGALSPSPARDPLGRYFAAIAEYQTDRSLAPFWWRLCDLPDGVPFFHARYAIAGLCGLPALEDDEAGGFRAEVIHGIVRLAQAFRRLIDQRVLDGRQAEAEFMGIGRLTLATFPFPELWCETLVPELGREQKSVVAWLVKLVPGLHAIVEKKTHRSLAGIIESLPPTPSDPYPVGEPESFVIREPTAAEVVPWPGPETPASSYSKPPETSEPKAAEPVARPWEVQRTTAGLARLESEISSLRSELNELKGTLAAPGALRVPIQSLDPEPFEVLSPMEAVIRPVDDGFIATFFDANINASGDTPTEAFENLKDMIVATFCEFTRLGVDRLGPEPRRQLAVLERFVRSREE